MAISTGTQRAVTEAASWLFGAALCVAGVVYHDEVRTALGLKFQPPSETAEAASDTPRSPSRNSVSREHSETPANAVRLRADSRGHFSATAYINGDAIDVLVDTGATSVALTWDDARRAGIHVRDSDFTMRTNTANGVTSVAPVVIDSLRIGGITVYGVQATVSRPRQQWVTLLGMSFLRQVRIEMRDRELVLTR